MEVLLLIARLLLAAVFGVAGVAKLLDLAGSRESVRQFGVPGSLAPAFAVILPLIELACAVALLRAGSAWWGAAGALALLLIFVSAIAVSLVRGRRPACHCFGQLHSVPVGGTTLARNAVLAGLAGLVAWQAASPERLLAQSGSLPALAGLNTPDAGVLALAMMAALLLFMLVMFKQLLRQNGRLLIRLEAIERKLAIGGEPTPLLAGLPVGSAAPEFNLKDLDGSTVTLGRLREAGKPLLLVFTEPGCGPCDTVLPDVANWQLEHAGNLVVVAISRGTVPVNRSRSETYRLQNVLLQRDREVAEIYRVAGTPSAVLVKEGRIASELAAGPDAVRALGKSATTPPPLKQGDRVPAMELRDLDGGTVDLATLSGRALLLFWNPSCGYCQAMVDDLKGGRAIGRAGRRRW